MKIIDGKSISAEIREDLKKRVFELSRLTASRFKLAIVKVGNDPASKVYIRNKNKACDEIGIQSENFELPGDTKEEELIRLINRLNNNGTIDGILVQLPLPDHINEKRILEKVCRTKDVDCFNPYNVGRLYTGNAIVYPCTPRGIIELLKRNDITIEGKNCVVVGRSNIVGKPMANMLVQENGTCTIAHSKTENLKELCKSADILVVAIGKQKYINSEYIKPGATVIDVGIHRLPDGKLCGDVDFDDVKDTVGAITPVPGGVGPMTVTMLLSNCIDLAETKIYTWR